MSQKYIPLSKTAHSSTKWKSTNGFRFAAKQALVRLMPSELPRAAHDFPIVFFRQGKSLLPVALLGLAPESNQFVDQDGRWLSSYIPALIQCYPFSLAYQGEGKFLPMVDAEALDDSDGINIYDDKGELGEDSRLKIASLLKSEGQIVSASKALATLEAMNLIVPWDIPLSVGTKSVTLTGFYRADEQRLKSLSDEQVLSLWRSGAFPMLFAHWFSLRQFARLGAVLKQPVHDASTLHASDALH